jgi:PTS system N-acetylglucosamine-specific IIC component
VFVAPILFAIHAVLTGLSMAIMDMLGVQLGFGFSAGLFDYVLNFNRATQPLLMLPVGIAYFVLYYAIFRFFIVRFDIRTPGRDETEQLLQPVATGRPGDEAAKYLVALGGSANLRSIDACTTRLRLKIGTADRIDEGALKALGAAGVVYPTSDTLQVIVGLRADAIATELRLLAESPVTAKYAPQLAESLQVALGGRANVAAVAAHTTRLRIEVRDTSLAVTAAIVKLGFRGAVVAGDNIVHILADDNPESIARDLGRLIGDD